MASFSAGTTFTDGVANDVTAAKLAALVNAATPTSGLIQDRTAETSTAVNDTLLIGDASDSNNLKRMTVANFAGTLPTATITTLNSTTGTITTLNSTTGTIATLNSTTGTIATLNSTTGTIATGVIPTLTSITKITSGTGTAAAPAISPTGDTNTGIFFPAADTIAFSEGGTESMRIDSSGNVGIGTASPTAQVTIGKVVNSATLPSTSANHSISLYPPTTTGYYGGGISWAEGANTSANICAVDDGASGALGLVLSTGNSSAITERLRINSSGNVGIGTASPSAKLDVSGSINATSGTIATLNSTTGTITNLSTTLAGDLTISQGTATVGTRVAVVNTAQEYTAAHNFNATTLTSGTSIAWNLSANQVARLVLSTNGTMADATNKVDGSTYILLVTQGTGSNTLAWNATYKWPGGTAPTLTTGSAKSDIFTFLSNGTSLFGVASQNYS